jgi:hypothetical protein
VTKDARSIRAAKNEDLFREVNERIRDVSASNKAHEFEVVCECTDATCREGVAFFPGEYEAVRAEGARFVAPGHDSPPIERIVEQTDRYWVVEKVGKAEDEAERLDPRQN